MKGQITIENMIILVIIISITLTSIYIMFKFSKMNENSYSATVYLYGISINNSTAKVYLSHKIDYPGSIIITYEPVNLSKVMTFNFSNCVYSINYSSINPVYIFYSSKKCNFTVFNGKYLILSAEYNNGNYYKSFVIKDDQIGYIQSPQVLYANVSLSKQIAQYGSYVSVSIETNIKNGYYSLFLGNYTVLNCNNIQTQYPCTFNLNSSIGVDQTNSFYVINAYVYNSTASTRANTTIYVS